MKYFVVKQRPCEFCHLNVNKDAEEVIGLFQLDEETWEWGISKGYDTVNLLFFSRKNGVYIYFLEFFQTILEKKLTAAKVTTKINTVKPGKNHSILYLEEVKQTDFETYETFGIEFFEVSELFDVRLEFIKDHS